MANSDSSPFRPPFAVVVSEPEPPAMPIESNDDGWTTDDLEAEWIKASEAADQATFLSEMTFDSMPELETAAPVAVEPDPPRPPATRSPAVSPVSLIEVLEALVFVGGVQLTSARLASLLGTTTVEVESLIDDLNSRYAAERRPYEIRFETTGYRIAIHTTFEGVRDRVHGHAPKEVRLTPEVLEVLAFVAYLQPVSRERLSETGKEDVETIVRQLIRRDLVALDRGQDGKDVLYRTTPRFLELFSLRTLNDLPRADDLRFK